MTGPGRCFHEGQSGNPSGRPKADQIVSELAEVHGPRAIEVLAELMNDPKATAPARAMAADRILDSACGRPPQLNTMNAAQSRRACGMRDDELARIAAGDAFVGSAEPLAVDPKRVN
jgi:hypothetical protein